MSDSKEPESKNAESKEPESKEPESKDAETNIQMNTRVKLNNVPITPSSPPEPKKNQGEIRPVEPVPDLPKRRTMKNRLKNLGSKLKTRFSRGSQGPPQLPSLPVDPKLYHLLRIGDGSIDTNSEYIELHPDIFSRKPNVPKPSYAVLGLGTTNNELLTLYSIDSAEKLKAMQVAFGIHKRGQEAPIRSLLAAKCQFPGFSFVKEAIESRIRVLEPQVEVSKGSGALKNSVEASRLEWLKNLLAELNKLSTAEPCPSSAPAPVPASAPTNTLSGKCLEELELLRNLVILFGMIGGTLHPEIKQQLDTIPLEGLLDAINRKNTAGANTLIKAALEKLKAILSNPSTSAVKQQDLQSIYKALTGKDPTEPITIDQLLAEIKRLIDERNTSISNMSKLKSELAECEDKLKTCADPNELDMLKKQLAELQTKLEAEQEAHAIQHMNDLALIETLQADFWAEKADLEYELTKARERADEAALQKDADLSEKNALEAQLLAAQNELVTARTELLDAETAKEPSQTKLADLRTRLQKAEALVQELQQKLTAITTKVNSASQTEAQATIDRTALEARLTAALAAKAQAEQNAKEKEAEAAAAILEAAKAAATAITSDQEKAKALATQEAAQAKVTELEAELATLRAAAAAAEADKTAAAAAAKSAITDAIADAILRAETAETRATQCEKELDELRKNGISQEKVQELQTQLDQAREEVRLSREELETLKQKQISLQPLQDVLTKLHTTNPDLNLDTLLKLLENILALYPSNVPLETVLGDLKEKQPFLTILKKYPNITPQLLEELFTMFPGASFQSLLDLLKYLKLNIGTDPKQILLEIQKLKDECEAISPMSSIISNNSSGLSLEEFKMSIGTISKTIYTCLTSLKANTKALNNRNLSLILLDDESFTVANPLKESERLLRKKINGPIVTLLNKLLEKLAAPSDFNLQEITKLTTTLVLKIDQIKKDGPGKYTLSDAIKALGSESKDTVKAVSDNLDCIYAELVKLQGIQYKNPTGSPSIPNSGSSGSNASTVSSEINTLQETIRTLTTKIGELEKQLAACETSKTEEISKLEVELATAKAEVEASEQKCKSMLESKEAELQQEKQKSSSSENTIAQQQHYKTLYDELLALVKRILPKNISYEGIRDRIQELLDKERELEIYKKSVLTPEDTYGKIQDRVEKLIGWLKVDPSLGDAVRKYILTKSKGTTSDLTEIQQAQLSRKQTVTDIQFIEGVPINMKEISNDLCQFFTYFSSIIRLQMAKITAIQTDLGIGDKKTHSDVFSILGTTNISSELRLEYLTELSYLFQEIFSQQQTSLITYDGRIKGTYPNLNDIFSKFNKIVKTHIGTQDIEKLFSILRKKDPKDQLFGFLSNLCLYISGTTLEYTRCSPNTINTIPISVFAIQFITMLYDELKQRKFKVLEEQCKLIATLPPSSEAEEADVDIPLEQRQS